MENSNNYNDRELNKDIFDLAPCGFFSAKSNGIILKVNNTFIRMTGYQREELLNKMYWQDLLTVGGKIYYETHYFPLLRLQGYVEEINFEILKKDGTKLPVLINTVQANDEESSPVLTHSSVLDITQRKQYEKELLLAKKKAENLVRELSVSNAELEKFAYIVSHDLQAPLGAIKGYTQILELKNETNFDEESKFIAKKILESTEKMSNLIRELLEYSKLKKKEMALEAVDLNDVWNYVLRMFEQSIIKNNARIRVPRLPNVKGNKTLLIQLFQNLLSNSLKYRSEKDPEIEINFTGIGIKWKFQFIDNGIGFEQKQADKVFEFFQRLQTKAKFQGTGIGLATCKKIVELHGGEIGVLSEPGRGSIFHFTLPAYQKDQ